MKQTFSLRWLIALIVIPFFIISCDKEEKPTPTNELMEGVWEVLK